MRLHAWACRRRDILIDPVEFTATRRAGGCYSGRLLKRKGEICQRFLVMMVVHHLWFQWQPASECQLQGSIDGRDCLSLHLVGFQL